MKNLNWAAASVSKKEGECLKLNIEACAVRMFCVCPIKQFLANFGDLGIFYLPSRLFF